MEELPTLEKLTQRGSVFMAVDSSMPAAIAGLLSSLLKMDLKQARNPVIFIF